MAKLNQKIEIVAVSYGSETISVTGFLGGMDANWSLNTKHFETYIDAQAKRGWCVGYSNGQGGASQLMGKMDWDEYYSDIRAFEEDTAEFIGKKKIKASRLSIKN